MRIVVEVQENKAAFLIELLKSLPFVKAAKVDSDIAHDLKEAIKEIQLHQEGEIELPDARVVFEDLSNEK